MDKDKMRCPEHPEFDPYSHSRSDLTCSICTDLYYSAREVGFYHNEIQASPKDVHTAKVVIGPLDNIQFGPVRLRLSLIQQFQHGPPWYVDAESMKIYLKEDLEDDFIEELLDMFNCKITHRTWKEPKLENIEPLDVKKDGKTKTLLTTLFIGENKVPVDLMFERGMSADEIELVVERFLTEFRKIPKDSVVCT